MGLLGGKIAMINYSNGEPYNQFKNNSQQTKENILAQTNAFQGQPSRISQNVFPFHCILNSMTEEACLKILTEIQNPT